MLEVVVTNLDDAVKAEKGGAKRVEIVSEPNQEGLTPEIKTVELIRNTIQIPIHVMIRNRNAFSGFSLSELKSMADIVESFKSLKVEGVVVGFLDDQKKIDFKALEIVLKNKDSLSVTFHRAFDEVENPKKSLKELIDFGLADRILTSGTAKTAELGIEILKEINSFTENKIKILAGGSISAKNICKIKNETGINEFHVGKSVRNNLGYSGDIDSLKVNEIVQKIS